MKKVIIVLFAALALSVAASAQPKALGLRATYGAELSYQHTLGASNFAELDLGWFYNGFYLTGVYDFNIGQLDGLPISFYAGPGASLGFWSNAEDHLHMEAGVTGQLGVEWQVESIPLNISLDWRPTFYFTNNTGFRWQGIALGIRYRF